ncbi:SH3 domain-containing protein 19 isoform X1 [Diachasma alloeum]|uniref:SH3 domain-containing protein 19 isoform X1 n=1 Tax=Diachasma alloeum TaxID=454923 RepID=UPI0007383CB8|nr:SH3 domain-containing protein 19 isoform X1 [Diachasma alloeum]
MLRGIRSKNNEMPIPTRAAPKPPGQLGQRSMAWSNSDPFGPLTMPQPVQKKKPPPRPPPPRFRKDNLQGAIDKSRKPTRPTELLGNLFGLKNTSKQQQVNPLFLGNQSRPPSTGIQPQNFLETGVSLIDLSPPGSPTFTTRSSSDGVSVDSFGSDGNSNPSVFTSSGNTSQTESAFEDDFDFFGSLNKPKSSTHDPWKTSTSLDPFSPVSGVTNGVKQVGDANFFAFNGETSGGGFLSAISQVPTMPTIIRARPPKPPAPKILPTSLAPTVTNFVANGGSGGSEAFGESFWSNSFEENCERTNPSPPMPSIPPPAPPAEYLSEVGEPVYKKQPHGIALYDFPVTQPDDLPLKEGDVVILKRQINDEWLEGQVGNRIGMFPANFVDIIVPLPGVATNVVTALYAFPGETWDDLPFEEGVKINVLSRISDEWLYGEYKGKRGQFPANYVNRVPHNLPKYSPSS